MDVAESQKQEFCLSDFFLDKDVLAHKRSFPQVSSLIIDLLGKMHSAHIPFFFFLVVCWGREHLS